MVDSEFDLKKAVRTGSKPIILPWAGWTVEA